MRELLARVKAMLRRNAHATGGGRRRASRGVRPAARRSRSTCARGTVRRDGQPVHLKPRAFDLLAFLAQNRGRVFSRDQLLEHVWGYDFSGDTRTVDVHVRWLREKIEADPSPPRVLETVRGVGYRLPTGRLAAAGLADHGRLRAPDPGRHGRARPLPADDAARRPSSTSCAQTWPARRAWSPSRGRAGRRGRRRRRPPRRWPGGSAPAAGARVTLIAADGVVLGDSEAEPATMENHAGRPEVAPALAGDAAGSSMRHSATVDQDLLYVAVPIRDGGRIVGVARVARERSRRRARVLARDRGGPGRAGARPAALAALLAWAIARRISRPLARADAGRARDRAAAGRSRAPSAPRRRRDRRARARLRRHGRAPARDDRDARSPTAPA